MLEVGSWWSIVVGALFVAFIELDAVHIGQFMVSRPIFLGSLLGLLFDRPLTGVNMGLCVELLSLDDLPVGNNLALNTTVAGAVGLFALWGPHPLPMEMALPLGLLAGWGHKLAETGLRQRRRKICCELESRLSAGENPDLGPMIAVALSQQYAVTLGIVLASVLLAWPVFGTLWLNLPMAAVKGLHFAVMLAPWLGAAVLLNSLRRQS